jgi:hypothetical protein
MRMDDLHELVFRASHPDRRHRRDPGQRRDPAGDHHVDIDHRQHRDADGHRADPAPGTTNVSRTANITATSAPQ